MYNDKDLIDVPELTGSWQLQSLDTNNTWQLTKHSDKDYILIERANHNATTYNAKFLKLNNQLFIDLQMVEIETSKPVPGHIIAKVTADSSIVNVSLFNSDYLVALAQKNKIQLNYQTSYDKSSDYNTGVQYTITEPTDKLQNLIIAYANDTNVFPVDDQMFRFKRRK